MAPGSKRKRTSVDGPVNGHDRTASGTNGANGAVSWKAPEDVNAAPDRVKFAYADDLKHMRITIADLNPDIGYRTFPADLSYRRSHNAQAGTTKAMSDMRKRRRM